MAARCTTWCTPNEETSRLFRRMRTLPHYWSRSLVSSSIRPDESRHIRCIHCNDSFNLSCVKRLLLAAPFMSRNGNTSACQKTIEPLRVCSHVAECTLSRFPSRTVLCLPCTQSIATTFKTTGRQPMVKGDRLRGSLKAVRN